MNRTIVSSLLAVIVIVRSNDKPFGRIQTIFKQMKFPSLPLGAMLFLSVLAGSLPSIGSAAQVMPTPGFNLGNTLESTWGYAPPTQALINSIADAGFKTLRVPCAWDFNSTNGTINAAYMTQVANVVDWALARGMYVIINCHWDGGWFEREPGGFNTYDSNLNSKLISIWTQIANRFKDYDSDRLSFACANEPDPATQMQVNVLYQYYQNWINAMRANGGGNAVRWLVIQAPSPWNWDILLNYGLNMPADPANKLMIEEHTYDPGEFSVQGSDEDWRSMKYFWGSGYHVTGNLATRNCTSQEESYLRAQFTRLKTNFVDQGYPVLIGEWAGQPKPTLPDLTGVYKDQNFRSVTYYNKYMENLISSFGFSGTYFAGQGDTFHPTTGAVLNQDKLNSILGISALPPIPGLADGIGALQTLLLFNEASGTTAADSTVNGRHGTLVGGPTRVTGQGGKAVDLDGTDDHVSLPTGVVSSLGDFTISTWVNLDAASPGSRIFDFGSGTTNYMFLTPANGTTGTVRFAITTSGAGGEQTISGTSALPTGAWTHVAVTRSGNLGILYVNGVEVGRNAALTLFPMALGVTTQNWIGRSQYSDPYLNGRVDDFRIYINALAASDVLALFNGTAGALAGPWASQDIGSVGLPGSSGSPGDDIYVTASGGDIWGGADACHYVSRTWTGDGTLIARVNGVAVTDTWTKAGLMFRESLSANARNAFIAITPGNNGISFQSRSSTGGGTANSTVSGIAAPYWLKLQRAGNVFTPYHSADGMTWTQTAAPVTLSLPTTCYVGFAATAHNNTLLTAAQFDHISLVASAPAPPTGLTATAGNAEIVLNWSAASDATGYHVKRATVSGGPYTVVANVATTSYTNTGLANGTTYYYVVAATNVYGVSPDSTEASATPAEIIGWWKFDATSGTTAADSGYGGNPGTLQSGATWVAGAINNAVHLNGTANGYVSLPSGLVSALNDFTISTWVKVDANATWARVFDFGSGTGNYMFLAPASGGASVRYAITTGSGEQQLNRAGNLSPGGWHHLAVTLSGSTGVLYVDGVPANTNLSMTLKPSSLGSTTQNYIGKSQWPDPNLTGSVDDFRIYNRALNATEVAALANPVPPAPAGLTAVAGNAHVVLNWNAASTATGYKIKRSLTSGSGYVNIATNANLTFTNTGLANGTLYYFVVSATNSFGESTNSTQVSARPTSSAPVAMNAANAAGQLQISWPADHTGWQLQSQTNNLASGLGTNWVNVTGSDQTNQMTMPLNATQGAVFFRLVRPY
jgi:aryl-phospho-beta-D-glucosidase BglC (GH1 family)